MFDKNGKELKIGESVLTPKWSGTISFQKGTIEGNVAEVDGELMFVCGRCSWPANNDCEYLNK